MKTFTGCAAAVVLAMGGSAHAGLIRPQPWMFAEQIKAEETAAAKGDVQAMLTLARRYETGDRARIDPARSAWYWSLAFKAGRAEGLAGLKRLAEAGSPDAQYLYGRRLVAAGHAVEGAQWMRKAADAGVDRVPPRNSKAVPR